MGEWLEPGNFGVLDAIADQFGVTDRDRFVAALIASGLVVRERYYVPDVRELYKLHWSIGEITTVRWVMCRETFEELLRRHTNHRVPSPKMAAIQVIEHGVSWNDSSMLFGTPIRFDPAARSPLFEVDSEATREGEAG